MTNKIRCTPEEYKQLQDYLFTVNNKTLPRGSRRIAMHQFDTLYKQIEIRTYREDLKNNIFNHPNLFAKYRSVANEEALHKLKTYYYEWKDETQLMGTRRIAKTMYEHLIKQLEKDLYEERLKKTDL